MSPLAFDTNILAYAEGLQVVSQDLEKIRTARKLIRNVVQSGIVPTVPVQVLAELHSLLLRKMRLPASEAEVRIQRFQEVFEIAPTTEQTLAEAMMLSSRHNIPTFDAVVLACARSAGCRFLLSEDLQDGFAWRELIVRNPFETKPAAEIAGLLR